MNKKEIFDILQTKGKDLSEWLKKNFDPYTVIVITSREVKIVQEEVCCNLDCQRTRE